jgi:D-alanine-D-alanine ligase
LKILTGKGINNFIIVFRDLFIYEYKKNKKNFFKMCPYKNKKIEIALLAGGWSGERDVSIKSGDAVYKALNKDRYNVTMYDPRDDLESLIRSRNDIDLAFILLHGKFGEDGTIQGLLDLLGVPFVGSGVLPSAIAFNKKMAKDIFKNAGLNVIKDEILYKGKEFSVDYIMDYLGPSTVVKPVAEGSSLGVSICHTREELIMGIQKAFLHDQEIMVESYIQGREVTCAVIGDKELETLPIVEIVPEQEHEFFDYEAKYTAGATKEICPAIIPISLKQKVEDCAKKAHNAIQCRTWSRIDMIIQGEDVYILEINTIPGMTDNSLVPLAARAAGISLPQLLDKLIDLSLPQR